MPKSPRKKTTPRRKPRIQPKPVPHGKFKWSGEGTKPETHPAPSALPSRSPWATAWFHPRETLRNVLRIDPKYGIAAMAWFVGFDRLMDMASVQHWGNLLPVWGIALIATMGGWPMGYLAIYIQGYLLELGSSLLNGQGNAQGTVAMVTWCNIPALFGAAVNILILVLIGDFVFKKGPDAPTPDLFSALLMIALGLCQIGQAVWQTVLLIGGLSEAQQFSKWRASAVVLTFFILSILLTTLATIL